jgi:hypothetical protein
MVSRENEKTLLFSHLEAQTHIPYYKQAQPTEWHTQNKIPY